jgi:hypothetical protein
MRQKQLQKVILTAKNLYRANENISDAKKPAASVVKATYDQI